MPEEQPGRLRKSITALCERVDALTPKTELRDRVKLIADVHTTSVGALLNQCREASEWLAIAEVILTRAIFVRSQYRSSFDVFARQALQRAHDRALQREGRNGETG